MRPGFGSLGAPASWPRAGRRSHPVPQALPPSAPNLPGGGPGTSIRLLSRRVQHNGLITGSRAGLRENKLCIENVTALWTRPLITLLCLIPDGGIIIWPAVKRACGSPGGNWRSVLPRGSPRRTPASFLLPAPVSGTGLDPGHPASDSSLLSFEGLSGCKPTAQCCWYPFRSLSRLWMLGKARKLRQKNKTQTLFRLECKAGHFPGFLPFCLLGRF